jgi:hypothetical protein
MIFGLLAWALAEPPLGAVAASMPRSAPAA